jgi:hypothetical protein
LKLASNVSIVLHIKAEIIMASVSELKEALLTEQTRAIEIADSAISAIGVIGAVSGIAIGVLGLIIAILAIFGYGWIRNAATKAAEKVADERMDSYVKTKDFKQLVETKLAEQIQKRWENTVVVRELQTPDREVGEASPFPEKEGE